MKKVLLSTLFTIASLCAFAQGGIDSIFVEKVQIPQSVIDAVDSLNNNSYTYRIFVDLEDNFGVSAIFGSSVQGGVEHPIEIATTTSFYNTELVGSVMGQSVLSAVIPVYPHLAYDSWLTLGASSTTQLGIPYSLDTDDGTVDGLVSGTVPSLTNSAISNGESFDTAFGMAVYAGTLNSLSAIVYTSTHVQGPAGTGNKVLLGQFTTDGDFSFKINLLTKNVSNLNESYRCVYNEVDASSLVPEVIVEDLVYPSTIDPDNINVVYNEGLFNIYPNPAKDFLNVEFSEHLNGAVNATVYDITGKAVLINDTVLDLNKLSLDVSALANGVYILKISNKEGLSQVNQFYKN